MGSPTANMGNSQSVNPQLPVRVSHQRSSSANWVSGEDISFSLILRVHLSCSYPMVIVASPPSSSGRDISVSHSLLNGFTSFPPVFLFQSTYFSLTLFLSYLFCLPHFFPAPHSISLLLLSLLIPLNFAFLSIPYYLTQMKILSAKWIWKDR